MSKDYTEEIDKNRVKWMNQRSQFFTDGPQCEKGWEHLYGPVVQLCNLIGVKVEQVKEKFGTLRIYVGVIPDEYMDMLFQLIERSEQASKKVCEKCGKHDGGFFKNEEDGKWGQKEVMTAGVGWIKTLCVQCRVKWEAEREVPVPALGPDDPDTTPMVGIV